MGDSDAMPRPEREEGADGVRTSQYYPNAGEISRKVLDVRK